MTGAMLPIEVCRRDHGGTSDDPSDDEFLEDLGIVKGSTGRNDTVDRDFCEDMVALIG